MLVCPTSEWAVILSDRGWLRACIRLETPNISFGFVRSEIIRTQLRLGHEVLRVDKHPASISQLVIGGLLLSDPLPRLGIDPAPDVGKQFEVIIHYPVVVCIGFAADSIRERRSEDSSAYIQGVLATRTSREDRSTRFPG